MAPSAPSPDDADADAVAMAKEGVAFSKANGAEEGHAELSSGAFIDRAPCRVAYDLDGKTSPTPTASTSARTKWPRSCLGRLQPFSPSTAHTAPARRHHTAPARRKVSSTGRRNTSRRPHQPAASASKAPATVPTSGTQGEGFQLNSKA